MAIDSISSSVSSKNLNVNEQQKTTPTSKGSNGTAAVGNSISTSDSINLTGTATQLRSLEQQLSSLPVVDVQRVDAVKREISNGTFEIDPPKIADKMIQIESAINQRIV